jgi:Zn-dependent protease/predicted transcriptional regulator
MRGWSLSIGTYFGVEIRLHALFVWLLPVIILLSSTLNGAGGRGLVLWLLLVAAVLVRETGRGIASAAAGLPVTRLILLPTGAAPSTEESKISLRAERLIALAGPIANFIVGITMALLMYTATAHINLFLKPWFSPLHLVQAAIWAQVLLGGLNLLPAWPLDAGIVLRQQFRKIRGIEAGTRAAAGVGQATAGLLVVLGVAMQNAWLVIMGFSVLLTSRSEAHSALASTAAGTVTVADVMLTEFTTLSASDTLEDAAQRSVRSLQDVFPVVRGSLVVGAISRETLLTALRTDGNGYVQSVMTKTIETTTPTDLLLPTLRRIQHSRGAQLVPVISDDRVIGIVTPGNLTQSMSLLGRTRRTLQNQANRNA